MPDTFLYGFQRSIYEVERQAIICYGAKLFGRKVCSTGSNFNELRCKKHKYHSNREETDV
jgi:hypothetical protein